MCYRKNIRRKKITRINRTSTLAPRCRYHDPAPMVTVPANGTRTWLTNDTAEGRNMNHPVSWTCPPDHAFSGVWSNELTKYCRFNWTLSVALWDYWEAPPDNRSTVNLTDWDIKHLPDCIRKNYLNSFIALTNEF